MKSRSITDAEDHITDEAIENSAATLLPAGIVLMVTRSGILAHTFPVGVTRTEVAVNQDLKALIPHEGLDAEYIGWALRRFERDILDTCTKHGTTVHSAETPRLKQFEIPIAPTNEQRRIVERIDELFSDIEEGERALERARKLLDRYRQAVLQGAVSGELTKDWCEKHKSEIESGEALLSRILKARREVWEQAELAKMRAKGQEPRDDRWKQKYNEPARPDMADLAALPSGWVWATLPMLGHFGRGKSKHRPRNDPKLYNGEYPFIQTGDVRASAGRITGFSQTYNDVGLAQSKLWPAGTICITIAANIAETGILQLDACFPDSVVGLIPSKMVVGEYVEMFLRTAREDVERYAPATAQKNINLDILSDIAVPMPPLDEQLAIANLAASALSEIDALVRAIGDAEDRIIAVRQSILTAAFSGKLVPQNPGDEPASVLLDRLRAERAATGGARVRRQRSSGQVRSPAIGVEPPQPRCDP